MHTRSVFADVLGLLRQGSDQHHKLLGASTRLLSVTACAIFHFLPVDAAALLGLGSFSEATCFHYRHINSATLLLLFAASFSL